MRHRAISMSIMFLLGFATIPVTVAQDHRTSIQRLTTQAAKAYQDCRYKDACDHYEMAMDLVQKVNPNSLDLAIILTNLGRVYWALGMLDQSERTYVRAIEIKVNKLGQQHESTLNTLQHYQAFLAKTGRAGKTISISKGASRSKGIDERTLLNAARQAVRSQLSSEGDISEVNFPVSPFDYDTKHSGDAWSISFKFSYSKVNSSCATLSAAIVQATRGSSENVIITNTSIVNLGTNCNQARELTSNHTIFQLYSLADEERERLKNPKIVEHKVYKHGVIGVDYIHHVPVYGNVLDHVEKKAIPPDLLDLSIYNRIVNLAQKCSQTGVTLERLWSIVVADGVLVELDNGWVFELKKSIDQNSIHSGTKVYASREALVDTATREIVGTPVITH